MKRITELKINCEEHGGNKYEVATVRLEKDTIESSPGLLNLPKEAIEQIAKEEENGLKWLWAERVRIINLFREEKRKLARMERAKKAAAEKKTK